MFLTSVVIYFSIYLKGLVGHDKNMLAHYHTEYLNLHFYAKLNLFFIWIAMKWSLFNEGATPSLDTHIILGYFD